MKLKLFEEWEESVKPEVKEVPVIVDTKSDAVEPTTVVEEAKKEVEALTEDAFKAMVTKLVNHELKEEKSEDKEKEEVAEKGLTEAELKLVKGFISANWKKEEPAETK